MEKLLEMGAKMELKDEELKQFVRDEQSRMRDEREKDRSERQAREDREFKLQMEKEYSDRAREERQHQLEMEARKEEFAASEHQRKIQELEADQQFQAAEKMQKSSMESTHVIETQQPLKGPKLPPFDEAKDNIDAYIQRFERYATAQNWIRINWGSHLSAPKKSLEKTGKALDVFARLPPFS